jgi:hypothetical protein
MTIEGTCVCAICVEAMCDCIDRDVEEGALVCQACLDDGCAEGWE